MTSSLNRIALWMSSRSAARALLAVLGLSIALCLWVARTPLPDPPPASSHPPGTTDAGLYRAIVARVHAGQDYEAAAAAEHRRLGYPLRPFVVVRPPGLATVLAGFPKPEYAIAVYVALALTVVIVWWRRLSASTGPTKRHRLILTAGLCSGLAAAMFTAPATIYFTETWTGFLISLSLGLRTDQRYVLAVLSGLAAGVLRELAIPWLAMMSVLALFERRRGEGAAFFAATVTAVVLLAAHGAKVNALATPQDLASPGWVKFGGLAFVLKAVGLNILAAAFGLWVAALLAPLCLCGASQFHGTLRLRLLATLAAYLVAFSVVGRPENDYWGFLIAPLVGLCAAAGPMAVAKLARSATAIEAPERVNNPA